MKRPAILMFSLLALVTVFCLTAATTINAWTRQGDDVSFLTPSEWGFGAGWWDGLSSDGRGIGGRIYKYGVFQRWTWVHPIHRL